MRNDGGGDTLSGESERYRLLWSDRVGYNTFRLCRIRAAEGDYFESGVTKSPHEIG
ncbi:MAG: hypothetical protein Q4C61_11410 [Lachnospiraceae bacterium]|nr:hypothetical protein [Lachnospiraceae bacterium]